VVDRLSQQSLVQVVNHDKLMAQVARQEGDVAITLLPGDIPDGQDTYERTETQSRASGLSSLSCLNRY